MGRTRTVTIVFTDLVASTKLLGALGPEVADDIRSRHFRLLERSAGATGGQVIKNLGDGLMVAYDSAARAVAGAVRMQQAVARQNQRPDDPSLGLRIGIGVGEATNEDGDWFGLPVVEASRLCGEAIGGQILCTATVKAVAGGVIASESWRALGARRLKGIDDDVVVGEVLWEPESDAASLPPGLAATSQESAFVGRGAELERVERARAATAAGERRLVLVSGEPGIGKTRLVSQVARRAADEGATVLYGRCYEENLTPYQPFVEALASVGQQFHELTPEIVGTATVVGAPPGSADTERYALFEAVASVIAGFGDGAPVVFAVDDLHWADTPTLLLLQHLVRSRQPMRLLLLATYRDTDLSRDHPLSGVLADLRRERLYERVSLRGLDESELSDLVSARAGDAPPPLFIQALHAETEGNPFFAEEVLLHLIESGAIYQRDGRWVSDAPAIEELGIPEGIREVIGRRVSRLSEAANQALAVAAVVGREFSLPIVEDVTGLADAALDALEEAAAARLVEGVAGAPDRYAFTHALVQQTLYEELSAARRVRLHQRVGAALERAYAGADDGPHLSELAHHFSQLTYGGDVDKALDYCRRAGERAHRLLAFEEAAANFRRALQMLELADRLGTAEECDLRLLLAESVAAMGDASQCDVEVRLAADLARRLADRARFVHAISTYSMNFDSFGQKLAAVEEALTKVDDGEQRWRVRLLLKRAFYAGASESFTEADTSAAHDEALRAARELNDPNELAAALWGWTTVVQPDVRLVQEAATELQDIAQRHPHPLYRMRALNLQITAKLRTGDITGVEQELDQVDAAQVRDVNIMWGVRRTRALLALLRGEVEDAERLAFEAYQLRALAGEIIVQLFGLQLFAIRREQGRLAEMEPALRRFLERIQHQPLQGPPVRAGLAVMLLELDRPDEAATEVETILQQGTYRRFEVGVIGIANLGEVAAALGLTDLCVELYDRLLPFDGQTVFVTGPAYVNGAVSRYLGLLASATGRPEAAIRHHEDAVAMNQRMAARPWVARTQIDYAKTLLARAGPGDGERAVALLDAAAATATELGLVTIGRQAERVRNGTL